MKKILSMILSFMLIASISTGNAYALSPMQVDGPQGKLYDEDGNLVATIVGERVETPSILANEVTSEISETYKFTVLSSIVNHEDTASTQDAYHCVTAYLTLNYKERQDEPSVFLLKNVSGSWTTPNDSRVSVIEAVLCYYCKGMGPDNFYTGQEETVELDVDAQEFYENTGFTDYVVADGISSMGANLTLTFLMGNSRTWTLYLEKNPININII